MNHNSLFSLPKGLPYDAGDSKASVYYDLVGITESCNFLRTCLDQLRPQNRETRLYHSLKANAFPPLLRVLASGGLGASVSNMNEFERAVECGFSRVCATSPAFSQEDIARLLGAGVEVYLSSLRQLEQVPVGSEVGLRLRSTLVNKGDAVGKEVYRYSRFGVDGLSDEIRTVLRSRHLKVVALLAHHRDVSDTNGLLALVEQITSVVPHFPCVRNVNFGGGMTALHQDRRQANEAWSRAEELIRDISPDISIRVEPGAQHMSGNGFLVSKVVEVMKSEHSQCAVLNASHWCLDGWARFELLHGKGNYNTTLVGPTCYEDDIWIRGASLPRLVSGETIVFGNAGSYVTSMARQFCLIEPPREYLLSL